MIEAEAAPRGYQVPPGLLAARVILVTGASGSLGGAVALACAAAGATVVLHGRDEKRLSGLYDAIAAKDKTLRVFTAEEGGAQHCQRDYLTRVVDVICDWLEEKLK
jgi:NAD(P)-dependent dehydrogenase (short-subunit alcohol dehydrogenase family)